MLPITIHLVEVELYINVTVELMPDRVKSVAPGQKTLFTVDPELFTIVKSCDVEFINVTICPFAKLTGVKVVRLNAEVGPVIL